jgi:hypothetical protein
MASLIYLYVRTTRWSAVESSDACRSTVCLASRKLATFAHRQRSSNVRCNAGRRPPHTHVRATHAQHTDCQPASRCAVRGAPGDAAAGEANGIATPRKRRGISAGSYLGPSHHRQPHRGCCWLAGWRAHQLGLALAQMLRAAGRLVQAQDLLRLRLDHALQLGDLRLSL